MLQKDGGEAEFLELEEVNERFRSSGQQSLESIHEGLVLSENRVRIPNEYRVPYVNTLIEESIQNVDFQEISNHISEIPVRQMSHLMSPLFLLKIYSKISTVIKRYPKETI